MRGGTRRGLEARATKNRGKERRGPFAAQGLRQNRKWSVLTNAGEQISADRRDTPNDDTKHGDGPHRRRGDEDGGDGQPRRGNETAAKEMAAGVAKGGSTASQRADAETRRRLRRETRYR